MRRVSQFPIPLEVVRAAEQGLEPATFQLELPAGAKIIAAGAPAHAPCMWAVVDPELPSETRRFALVDTDELMPEGVLVHAGSFETGGFVGHLFEVAR